MRRARERERLDCEEKEGEETRTDTDATGDWDGGKGSADLDCSGPETGESRWGGGFGGCPAAKGRRVCWRGGCEGKEEDGKEGAKEKHCDST